MLLHERLTHDVIGAAIEVHRILGPGLLESAYEHALCHELSLRNIAFRRQVDLPVLYKGVSLGSTLRMDFLIHECLVLEVKAHERTLPVHASQLLTYLRLSGHRTGLLINFNVNVLKTGILRRIV